VWVLLFKKERNFLLGETGSADPTDPACLNRLPSKIHLRQMAGLATRYYPILKDLKVIRTFSVPSPYTQDMEPVFGKTKLEGLYVAAGFKSCVVITTAVGKEMTEII